jgi:hypothetical protein
VKPEGPSSSKKSIMILLENYLRIEKQQTYETIDCKN